MPPEDLRFTREIASGRVDTSRPGRTVLSKLGDALGVAGRSIQTGLTVAEEKEAQEIAGELASPLLTPEEAAELEEGAFFPLNALKAQNRQGELAVQQLVPEIADRVAEATNAVEARKILRQYQTDLLEANGDQPIGVAAGIRERMSREASTLLGAAAQARVQRRGIQERLNVNEDLRLSLENYGGLGFVNTLIPHLTDEAATGNGNVSQLISDAITTLENHYVEGLDPSNPNGNLNTPAVIQAIDTFLEDIPGTSKQRKPFVDLRKSILSSAEAQRRASASSKELSDTKVHERAYAAAEQWMDAHPGQPLPQEYRARILSTSPTASQRGRANEWLQENAIPQGVLNTPTWEEGTSLLRVEFQAASNSVGGVSLRIDGASLADAVAIYESFGANLPVQLADDPEKLLSLRERAISDAVTQAKTRAEERKQADQELTDLKVTRTAEIEALNAAGDAESASLLRQDLAREIREREAAAANAGALQWVQERGYHPHHTVNIFDTTE